MVGAKGPAAPQVMLTSMARLRVLLASLFALLCARCTGRATCTTGQMQLCSHGYGGNVLQRGYALCDLRGVWTPCIPAGRCETSLGELVPSFFRCTTADACGPSSCASCDQRGEVQNPSSFSLCVRSCQTDDDCALSPAAAGVSPSCVRNHCVLRCTTGASCPNDTQCLRFIDATAAALYPGFDGLCE